MTKPPIVIVKDLKSYRAEDVPEEWLWAIAKELGFAVNADDVRRRFGDEPLTSTDVLDALETATSAPAMEVDATTSDEELDRFLFGPD